MFRKTYFLVLLFLLLQNLLTAQDTVLTLNKLGVDKFKKLSYIIAPLLAYNPETRFIFGAVAIIRLKQKTDAEDALFNRPSTIMPSVRYTLNQQFIATVVADLYFNKIINVHIQPRFAKYPDVYFGVGNHTQNSDRETFVDENFTIKSTVSGIFFKKEFIGLVIDIRDHELFNFEKGRKLDSIYPTGTTGGLTAGAGLSFRHDTRDDIFYPTKGYYLHIQGVSFPKLSFNKYFFNNFLLDYRHIVSIVNKNNILAFQGSIQVTDGIDVPFYELKRIGGDDALRGIHARKYLGKNAMYAQVEYRRFLYWKFSAALFAGLGDVSNTFSAVSYKNLKYNYGVGLRYKLLKDEKINVRFDVGFGPDRHIGFYLEGRESF